MKNKSGKKAIVSYYIMFLCLTLPLLVPFWLIKEPILKMVYFFFFMLYLKVAANLSVKVTITSSLFKELDAEKYAEIIDAGHFHYTYKLNLYLAVGDYQAAYNIISSTLLRRKEVKQKFYDHLLLCRICFERGDYEGLKEHLDQINNYFKQNPKLKLSKDDKEAYEFYCAFYNADYKAACSVLEKGIEKYSKNKNGTYIVLIRQYKLAVTKRMMGDVDEASALFEGIKEKSPKLSYSTLAQKQLDYISGTAVEQAPERLEATEVYNESSSHKAKTARVIRIVLISLICIVCLSVVANEIFVLFDTPKQEDKDLHYMLEIARALEDDDYEDFQILGYFVIYSDYAEETYNDGIDYLFLVEGDGSIDLHTLYRIETNATHQNRLNVKGIQVDTPYEYEAYFSDEKVEFVLTEKERDVPRDTLYYYEVDGYYFCIIGIS